MLFRSGAVITGLGGKLAGFIGKSITYLGVAGPYMTSFAAAGIWGGSWYFEDTYDSYLHQISEAESEGGM